MRFKIGDRVKSLWPHYDRYEKTAIITEASSSQIRLKWDDGYYSPYDKYGMVFSKFNYSFLQKICNSCQDNDLCIHK